MQLRHALVGIAALAAVLVAPLGAHAVPGITPVGTLERFPQEAIDAFGPEFTDTSSAFTRFYGGTLLSLPGARQLWQLYPHRFAGPRTAVLVRDADSLRVIGSFVIPHGLRRAGSDPTGGGEWLHTTDGGRRVFLVTVTLRLLEVDATTFAVQDRGPLSVAGLPISTFEPLVPAGLTYDSSTGDLLVLYGGPPAFSIANRVTVLQRIDLATGARTNRVVRSCTGPLPGTDIGSDTYSPELLLRPDAVFLTCQRQVLPLPVGFAEGVVVRLPRASLWDADGEEASVVAGAMVDTALADPVGGRIAVLDITGTVTVVDIGSMTVAGTFDTTDGSATATGAGLDRTSGRLFFQSNKGFGYLGLRPTPLPAPTLDTSAAADGQERIVPDPRTNRVYDLPGTAVAGTKASRYTIYNVAP